MSGQAIEAAPSAPLGASDLIGALRQRSPRMAIAVATVQTALPIARKVQRWARSRTTYTIKVMGGDQIFDDLHEWLLSLLPEQDQRALIAATSTGASHMLTATLRSPGGLTYFEDGKPEPAPPPRMRMRYDGSTDQTVVVAGHRVRVSVVKGRGGDSEGRNWWVMPEMTFTVSSLEARDALRAHMDALLAARHSQKRRPHFRMLSRWGDWALLDELPPRSLESVVLPTGQLDRLVGDVGRWLDAEGEYARRSIPWHRGHLYEGPPGTGKTSVARAVADHFGMDVWYLPLSDIDKDASLLRLIASVSPRSMLLLEDVDVFHAATEREEGDKVTLSGLLNALDGLATPHGLLTVMTTNEVGALDSALVRPGRVDLSEHFGLADLDQVAALVAHHYGTPTCPGSLGTIRLPLLAPSDVVEVCKRYDTAGEAWTELLGRPA